MKFFPFFLVHKFKGLAQASSNIEFPCFEFLPVPPLIPGLQETAFFMAPFYPCPSSGLTIFLCRCPLFRISYKDTVVRWPLFQSEFFLQKVSFVVSGPFDISPSNRLWRTSWATLVRKWDYVTT